MIAISSSTSISFAPAAHPLGPLGRDNNNIVLPRDAPGLVERGLYLVSTGLASRKPKEGH